VIGSIIFDLNMQKEKRIITHKNFIT